MSEKNVIGNLIKNARIEKGLKQTELAEMANISYSAIQKYEQGKREPKYAIIESIAKALNLTTFELLNVSPDSNVVSVVNDEITDLGTIDEIRAKRILEIINYCQSMNYGDLMFLHGEAKSISERTWYDE